jgi:predicted ester cyclase
MPGARIIQEALKHVSFSLSAEHRPSQQPRDHIGTLAVLGRFVATAERTRRLGPGLGVSRIRERTRSMTLDSSGQRRRKQMSQTLTIDQRIEVPRRFMAEVFIGHSPDQARDFFTPDALWHGPSIAEVSGVDNIVGLLGAFIGALSNIKAEEKDVIASGDLVALRQVVTATQAGDLLGIPSSGRDVRWDAVDIYRMTDDGKISEQWAFEDMAAIGSQLGAFSLPWAN